MRRRIGEWVADDQTDVLSRDGDVRKLERRAMAVLFYLSEHAGEVVSKDDLITAVWGDVAISDHSVAIVISQLRRAFGDDRAAPAYIQTIPKRGYRLVAEVTESVAPDAAPHPAATRIHKGYRLIGAGLALVAVLFAATLFAFQPHDDKLIIVSETVNGTGSDDHEYAGYALNELIASELAGRRSIRVRKEGAANGMDRKKSPGAAVISARLFSDQRDILVSVQMTMADTSEIVHGEAYLLSGRSIVEVAHEIALDAARAIGAPEVISAPTENLFPPETYALYWRARYSASFRQHDTLRRARDILVTLIGKYPDFAAAHAALADIYAHKTGEHLGLPRVDTFAEAQAHLDEARRLGGETSDIAVTEALLSFYRDLDVSASRAHIAQATKLAPANALAWQTKAMIESAAGNDSAALEAVNRALSLDNSDPSIHWDKVWFLYIAGKYKEALEAAVDAERYSPRNYLYLSLINEALGRHAEAYESWAARARERGLEAASPKAAGEAEDYRRLLEMAAHDSRYTDHGATLALARMRAGDVSGARAALLAAGPPRNSWFMLWARRLPELAELHGDPEIAVLFAGLDRLPKENGDLNKN